MRLSQKTTKFITKAILATKRVAKTFMLLSSAIQIAALKLMTRFYFDTPALIVLTMKTLWRKAMKITTLKFEFYCRSSLN